MISGLFQHVSVFLESDFPRGIPRGIFFLEQHQDAPHYSGKGAVDGGEKRGYFGAAMMFEFDETKSAVNRAKHGLDFAEAQQLWLDVDAVELPARSDGENRKMLIARSAGNVWSAIFTERENRIRIISVRRARTNERALYEQTEDEYTES